MKKNVSQNIVNLIKCRKGEHCLFRSFGMGSTTDDIPGITRSFVQVEVNRWFPGNTVLSLQKSGENAKGEFVYNINIRG